MTLLGRWLTWVTVRGHSMSPTLHDRQRLLVRKLRRPPRRGDVVVFAVPDTGSDAGDPPYRVKRVAAVGGDPVPDWLAGTMPGVARVPAGHVVVAGDNRRSQDSRHLGLVAVDDIVGTAPTSAP
ncbi:signal peptidase I [Actinophytocola sp. NPDC049390]|uniref:signal peptidase I n=1 Tax=Actinophytocola sp. NPDC049390 TaxID=3363894 RepID=UPI0037BDCCDF